MHRETLGNLDRSPFAENCKRIVLAMKGLEGPNTQHKAERLMAATGHLLEDVMDTFHQPGVDEEVADKIVQHPVVLQTTLEEIS